MHRYLIPALAPFLATALMAGPATAQPSAPLEPWRSYTGVTWHKPAADGSVQPYADSANAPIAGIHFDARNRAFVSTPRLISPGAPATLSILDTAADGGPARLTAFPSEAGNAVDASPEQHLRNVLGFYIDRRNGWLWALDQGFVAGQSEAPHGAQKLMVYQLSSGKLLKRIGLDAVADRKGSFLNDIVVDERRKITYISDSGLRSAPANQVGIIVVDYASSATRRLLDRHPALAVEPGARVMSHGEEVWPGKPLLLGINGIALSPDAGTLYWTVTTGTKAYAISTAVLRQRNASQAEVAAAVRELGEVGGNTDGIATDRNGMLYITDVTHNGIAAYDPKRRTMRLLASDERVYWPDTPTMANNGDLIFTASNLNRHFAGAVKPGEERYTLWRLPLAGPAKARD
ncbi:L-dopachrome tautomerase-related protein [Herbaspirillum sp. SJZ099]|uniref:L-dopachrome tautomerase-related protein n=1 Tax=Herbaspirillum sp. SJZ099 TaxID=2572916 RepID=UPI0011A09B53|nr:sugar lactone lactonase YvrE [Herbaspirillum sp. SJZ099]